MITVYKYTLATDDPDVTIKMPVGAKVHHVGNQHGKLCLWAEVDTNNPLHDRRFRIAGTGHSLECEEGTYLNYKGAAFFCNGGIVLHVYEMGDVPF